MSAAWHAHTADGAPPDEWEPLEAHLEDVAELAAGFAAAFQAASWGRIAGLWHDLGKYSAEFQQYLRSANGLEAHLETRAGRVDHSTAGAQHAERHFGGLAGRILAYCIAGHHGGLLDNHAADGGPDLVSRLKKIDIPSYSAAPRTRLELPPLVAPSIELGGSRDEQAFRLAVFCRMLFSCLVDADYIATERFMSPERAEARVRVAPALQQLLAYLDKHLSRLSASAQPTPVNRNRREVLNACRVAAEEKPGLFSLTVPTGGGKTLSSLAFGMRHAVRRGMRRVIYAIPYTSIIEQNARVFREALAAAGSGVVLEHHCNLDPKDETVWGRLATENWDAPLIVTTNVQFYESLFANKPSRCRKLHRIARSVIILDEAQSLPVQLLRPTLAMLEELCRNYGCTAVLCSATQPAVKWRDDFKIGLHNVREIVPNEQELFTALRRVEVTQLGPLDNESLVARLGAHEQALCIVNTRKHAAALFTTLRERDGDGVFHLSAQMCPAHRADVLKRILRRLDPSCPQPCRVVSTQVIEAGVDIDFPVVYRAMAGLDSIAQAAGRCNREGRLPTPGKVFVFDAEIPAQMSEVRLGAQDAREIAALHDDPFSLAAIEAYFKKHYWGRQDEWDKHKIMRCFSLSKAGPHFQFREAAEKYRLIRDEQQAVIVPYGDRGRRLCEAARHPRFRVSWNGNRRLQQYAVGVREYYLHKLRNSGTITQYQEQFWIVEDDTAYDRDLGLRMDVVGIDPEGLMI